jgi:hypothetical protein
VWAVGNLHKFHTYPTIHVRGENLRPFVTPKKRPLSRPAMLQDDFLAIGSHQALIRTPAGEDTTTWRSSFPDIQKTKLDQFPEREGIHRNCKSSTYVLYKI